MRKPTPYQPNGLAHPTREERRNGFTPEKLTDFLRGANATEYEFRRDLYIRAKDRERIAQGALARFKKDKGLDKTRYSARTAEAMVEQAMTLLTDEDKAQQAELEREAAEATADAAYAADRYTETTDAA